MPLTNVDELRQWIGGIKAAGSLSDEEVATLERILGKDKVLPALNDQVLMRGDYTQKTQQLADQRKQLEAEVNNVLQERADLAAWRKGVDEKYQKAVRDLEAARITQNQFEQRIRTIADQNGLDPAQLLDGIAVSNPQNGNGALANGAGANGAAGNPQYLTQADIDKLLNQKFGELGILASGVPAELFDIAFEHQQLTGKPLSGAVELWRTAVKEGKSLRDKWEGQYSIPQLRKDKEREQIRAEERAKLDAEYTAKLSENTLHPGAAQPGLTQRHSVMFEKEMKTPAEREAAAAGTTSQNGVGSNGQVHEPPLNDAAARENRFQHIASGYLTRRAQGVKLGDEAPAAKP